MSYVLGVDGGTEGLRIGIFNAATGAEKATASCPYTTTYPSPGYAEQDPLDWYKALRSAVQDVLSTSGIAAEDIKGMALDTTCCSVCALDAAGDPLRPCIIWMDMRSHECAADVLATGDAALRVNSNGKGPVSSEWMIPKALWIKRNEPDIYAAAAHICEYQDVMNFWLTGNMVASITNATIRWHYQAKTGWPVSLLAALDMSELLDKWPKTVLALGERVGGLTAHAARYLGLPEGLTVAQGGADAFMGMLGLGVVNANELALLTGSSHLHLGLATCDLNGQGFWGAYDRAVLSDAYVVEGGQTSTGSVAAWFKRTLCDAATSYKDLDSEASSVPIGCEGLVCLDHFQGNRTPYTDSLSRGAFIGLTLKHTRGHMFRAIIEAVCMGTELVLEAMRDAGYVPTSIAAAGGAARSPLWLQTHADVSGVPLRVIDSSTDACLLGAAVVAAVGAGVHASLKHAVRSMVKVDRVIMPNMQAHQEYKAVLHRYRQLYQALKPIYHGVNSSTPVPKKRAAGITLNDALHSPQQETDSSRRQAKSTAPVRAVRGIVNASILAADMCSIGQEVHAAITVAQADWCHVDIVDNVFAPILTFGPAVVKSLRQQLPDVFIDVHLAVVNPGSYINQLQKAGASQVLFHIEACVRDASQKPAHEACCSSSHDNTEYDCKKAAQLCSTIHEAGMRCGIVINPSTPVAAIMPLLRENLLDCVDVLAVEPGFGGQVLQDHVLQKVAQLREMCPTIDIQVDGGVTAKNASACVAAGANILTAGSSIFGASNYTAAVAELRSALETRW